jgi:hypothetical protein
VLQSTGFCNSTFKNPSSHPDAVVGAYYGVWATAGRKPQSIDASPLMTEDVETLTVTQLRAVLPAERAAYTATLTGLRATERRLNWTSEALSSIRTEYKLQNPCDLDFECLRLANAMIPHDPLTVKDPVISVSITEIDDTGSALVP